MFPNFSMRVEKEVTEMTKNIKVEYADKPHGNICPMIGRPCMQDYCLSYDEVRYSVDNVNYVCHKCRIIGIGLDEPVIIKSI